MIGGVGPTASLFLMPVCVLLLERTEASTEAISGRIQSLHAVYFNIKHRALPTLTQWLHSPSLIGMSTSKLFVF